MLHDFTGYDTGGYERVIPRCPYGNKTRCETTCEGCQYRIPNDKDVRCQHVNLFMKESRL